MKSEVKLQEIRDFVCDHIKSKSEHDELTSLGILCEKDLQIFGDALFEGIINGLVWAGKNVEGIDVDPITIPCSEAIKQGEKNRLANLVATKENEEKKDTLTEQAQEEIIDSIIKSGNELITSMIKSGCGKGASGSIGIHFVEEVKNATLKAVRKHFKDAGYEVKLYYTNWDYTSDILSHTGELEIKFI